MRNSNRPLTLHLRPTGYEKHLRRPFSGTLLEERTQESRRQNVSLSAQWCSRERLRVAPSADESGRWWAEQWPSTQEEEVGGLEVRLVPGGGRGR
jgi:hypothetical protein